MGADLGPIKFSKATVYATELLGILYSMISAVTARNLKRATLFVDNQAAIQSVHSPGGQSGQMILRQIIHFINALRRRGYPGDLLDPGPHCNTRNEKPDIIAKQATG